MQLDDVKVINALLVDKNFGRRAIAFVANQKQDKPYFINNIEKLYVGQKQYPISVYRVYWSNHPHQGIKVFKNYCNPFLYMYEPRIAEIIVFEGAVYTRSDFCEIGAGNYFQEHKSGQIEIIR